MRSRRSTRGLLRASAVTRAGWGFALLVVPERVLAISGPGPVPTHALVLARVLGARQLLQSAATVVAPTRPVAAVGAAVDLLHAGTDVALAAVSPRWRRIAVVDALLGAALIAVGRTSRSLDG